MAIPVAVLVDGDNICGKHAAKILSIAGKHGDPSVVRVYMDARKGSEWHCANGYRLLHAGTGKNAADILLALDAMELVSTQGFRNFVLSSSDGDFTHLASILREHRATVIGIGESKAPAAFRSCCNEFVEIGATQAMKLVPEPVATVSKLDRRSVP